MPSSRAWSARWYPTGGGGGGSLDHCFNGLAASGMSRSASQPPPTRFDYEYAVTADPTWRIQEFVRGRWTLLPTVRGVYFHAPGPPMPSGPGTHETTPRLRPVMPNGQLPACWAGR